MWRCLGFFFFAFILARADDARACAAGIPYDPPSVVRGLTHDQIIGILPEVVVEGVIEDDPVPAKPLASTVEGIANPELKLETAAVHMRVEQVWKGKLSAPVITVRLDATGTDCSRDPPFGKRIRIGGTALTDTEMFYQDFDLPVDQWDVDEALRDYRNLSIALEAWAEAGGRAEKLAFGEHLLRNKEWRRAKTIYKALLDVDPLDLDALLARMIIREELGEKAESDETLAKVRPLAPKTSEWQGRIARADFRATGHFEPGWLDWTNLDAGPWAPCEPGSADLRGAAFDGARLPDRCDFSHAQLQASFRAANFKRAILWDPTAATRM